LQEETEDIQEQGGIAKRLLMPSTGQLITIVFSYYEPKRYREIAKE
jgi:hypothetical protein